ncbi:PIG-F-domain-containing protein [Aspergillus ellipticus CBS 707.79]|uniref:PIG-F-domain-containing protein n=1 Tax=Aspergillus ellipticus CBS 707.79 TaxID=1448320 RepID=A0A319CWR9_9EURO|nr:PIG-F-domain-containing protein [Aspergillus ellipticus CBS 707.79]
MPSPPSSPTPAPPIITTPQSTSPSTSSSTTAMESEKSAPPVPVLPTPLAKACASLYPLAVLAFYAARFQKVVDDPVAELAHQVPILLAAQVAFVVVCLPAKGTAEVVSEGGVGVEGKVGGSGAGNSGTGGGAGSGVILRPGKVGRRRTPNGGHASGSGSGSGGAGGAGGAATTLTILLATPVLATLLILFGAPFTTHHLQTLLCAVHMAILSSVALVYVHGVDGAVWREVWGVRRPGDVVWGGALGTCVGAWLGAVPIPLDWDRPWQAYPITILTGAYIGWAVGMALGRTLLYGKRIRFVEGDGELKKVE